MVFEIVLPALFIVAVIILIIFSVIADKKRRERLQSWAKKNGFSFNESEPQLMHHFREFSPFGTGSSRIVRNSMHGKVAGRPLTLFDYQYTVQSGKNSTTHHFKIIAVRMPFAAPDLTIQKEHVGHKLFDALGGEDIDFESDEFSRKFWVKCRDRKFAYDVVHPKMINFLMAHPKVHWQWRRTTLLIAESGKLEPTACQQMVSQTMQFVKLLPRHLQPEHVGFVEVTA